MSITATVDAAAIATLDFSKGSDQHGPGLIPAVVQHAHNGSVLMLGYMNAAAVQTSLARQRVVFYSRSKQRLWEKGETSGNTLQLVSIRTDCDRDSLLISALPAGPVCHLGLSSCFGDEAWQSTQSNDFLESLERRIAERVRTQAQDSYSAKLHKAGTLRIAQKVGEEGVELALAAAAQDDQQVISEAADLLFHLLLLLKSRKLGLAQVVAELKSRA
jgi:phosphoribosyl-AMP cyclohydrolase / phosphoribosyl-ATP pyrophosphohydrolase